MFDAAGAPAGLRGEVIAAADLFDPATVEAIAQRLVRVLDLVAADPQVRLSEVDVLGEDERRQVLADWNDTAVPGPDSMVPELFAAQVARAPDAVAVVCGGLELTYGELDGRASRLARYLGAAGVGAESVVGLCLPRGAAMVTAMLAVWKAGGGLPAGGPGPARRADRVHAGRRRCGAGAGPTGLSPRLSAAGAAAVVALDDPAVAAALAVQPDGAPRGVVGCARSWRM